MEENYDALKLENQLCFPLYAAAREVVRKYTPHLEEIGLTYTQYITMMLVWEMGEVSVKALGERLFLDSGTLTPVLKALEKKGHVVRSRSKEDERVLLISLTEEGTALKEKAIGIPAKVGSCFPLTPEESVALYTILYKILGNL